MERNVWFVTGASKGLGLALVVELLEQNFKVAATSRSIEQLKNAVRSALPPTAASIADTNFLPLQVDLTNFENVKKSVDETVKFFGTLDVVVNNAGYGYAAPVEEVKEDEARTLFDVNFFAVNNVIKASLHILREKRNGLIYNISSIGAFSTKKGWGMYAASKAAVVALSEVLNDEVSDFGIHVIAVEPGPFRTKFISAESLKVTQFTIDEYENVHKDINELMDDDKRWKGDPQKAAKVFIEIAKGKEYPTVLFLGRNAVERAESKIQHLQRQIDSYRELSINTEFS